MADDWRVSVILDHHATTRRRYQNTVRDLLSADVGGGIKVTAEKGKVFIYTETADAAEQTTQLAREVLTRRGISADVRLEHWDSSDGSWRDMRAEPVDSSVGTRLRADQAGPGRSRLRSVAARIGHAVESVIDSGLP